MKASYWFALAVTLMLCEPPLNAQSVPSDEIDSALGLSVGVDIALFSPSKDFDADGESMDRPEDTSESLWLFNLEVRYSPEFFYGAYLGLDLPLVNHSESHVGAIDLDENSLFGVGDFSLFAGYGVQLLDRLHLGIELRGKGASGKSPDDIANDIYASNEAPTGSGFANAQGSVSATGNLAGVSFGLLFGYVAVLSNTVSAAQRLVELDPGDYLYADVSIGAGVLGLVYPKLHLLFANSGDATMEGIVVPDTGTQWVALALEVSFPITDWLSGHVGWGSPLDAAGLNLPYGFVITGKNVPAGPLALNAGLSASF